MPRACCQRTSTVCRPAGTVRRSSPSSGRDGRSSPSIVTCCTSASFGIRRTRAARGCCGGGGEADALEAAAGGGLEGDGVDREGLPLDALRVGEGDGDRLARPGAVLGAKTPSARRETGGGRPPCRTRSGCTGAATPRTRGGPRARAGRPAGPAERRFPCGLGLVAAEAPATSPFSTTRLARVSPSPEERRAECDRLPTGVTRRTRVPTIHVTPKPSLRMTSSQGASRPSVPAAPPGAEGGVERIDGSAGPSCRRPLTSHPALRRAPDVAGRRTPG